MASPEREERRAEMIEADRRRRRAVARKTRASRVEGRSITGMFEKRDRDG